jgi:alpha-methylacyl-CoA racemase
MMLAGMGARVVRIERPGAGGLEAMVPREHNLLLRDRERVELDLKSPEGVAAALEQIAGAQILIEGFRPGVMERLGLGPEVCQAHNPALVYGRVTGWGQEGPLAQVAGHDINYLALSGALHAMGQAGGPPAIPMNLVADFGGGGMLLAFGVLAALHEAQATGQGKVVDAAMIDGVASLMASIHGMEQAGMWPGQRGENLLDGGAPFYNVYECACGGHLAVGAIEPQFYALLISGLGLDPSALPHQLDRARWPELQRALAQAIHAETRDTWAARFEGTDACVTPVLSLGEVAGHPHHEARGTYETRDGITHPERAPRVKTVTGD